MKKITGSLLVCTGAGVFAATALLVGPVTSRPAATPAPVPAAAAAASPPLTAADGGPVDPPGHGNHRGASTDASASSNGASNGATSTAGATIRISNFAFEAQPVSPGATVTVTNADQAPHTVTAQDGSFSVSVAAGATTTFTAPNRAGSFAFFCEIHPQMSGTLTVR